MGIIAALIASAVVAATASIGGSIINAASTRRTNEQNIEMQDRINAQNQYNMEHAHQIEMNDLKEAGLNPVLTATGGSGAPVSMLQSAKAQAPQVDLSGIGTAMSGIQHALTMQMMMEMRSDIANERNATLSAIAKGHDSQSAANAALRASLAATKGQALLHSSRQGYNAFAGMSPSEISKIKRIAKYNLWK